MYLEGEVVGLPTPETTERTYGTILDRSTKKPSLPLARSLTTPGTVLAEALPVLVQLHFDVLLMVRDVRLRCPFAVFCRLQSLPTQLVPQIGCWLCRARLRRSHLAGQLLICPVLNTHGERLPRDGLGPVRIPWRVGSSDRFHGYPRGSEGYLEG